MAISKTNPIVGYDYAKDKFKMMALSLKSNNELTNV